MTINEIWVSKKNLSKIQLYPTYFRVVNVFLHEIILILKVLLYLRRPELLNKISLFKFDEVLVITEYFR